MAASILSTSCLALSTKMKAVSLHATPTASSSTSSPYFSASTANTTAFNSLGFSSNLSSNFFNRGCLSMSTVQRPIRHSIVCEAAPKKKADSAIKRARQAEKRRVYNKARKSEIRTRMKKVMEALDELKKKPEAQPEEVLPIEKLIAEAYSIIDKAVKVGSLHRNTGARRKSRLARNKKAVEIHHGWYTPTPAVAS